MSEGEVLPLPSCPNELSPQQTTPPPWIAHAKLAPAAIAVAPETPETFTGLLEQTLNCPWQEPVTLAFPSWWFPFWPQHSTVPLERSAQTKSSPPAIWVTPLRPATWIGVVEHAMSSWVVQNAVSGDPS